MNCEEARKQLDAYIDGELSEVQKRALLDHAQTCEICAQELQAARILHDTLAHIDDDLQPPLAAQAAWRNAIRAEAKKKHTRRWMRVAYSVAAALVLVIGGGFAFREANLQQPQVMQLNVDASVDANEWIARDGVARNVVAPEDSFEDYTVLKKIYSDNPVQDRQELEMLAEEYNGSYSELNEKTCRIEISQAYLEDFLNAASRIGREQFQENVCDDADNAVVVIQFCEEESE